MQPITLYDIFNFLEVSTIALALQFSKYSTETFYTDE